MTHQAYSACPATREAVWEQENDTGDFGCPLCGRDAYAHRVENPAWPEQPEDLYREVHNA